MSYVPDEIFADVDANLARLSQSDTQLDRLNYVRSLFAALEGSLANMRETVAGLMIQRFETTGNWRLHEIVPPLDEDARLIGTGELRLDGNRQPFLPLFAFVLRKYAELVEIGPSFFGENGWQCMQAGLKLRHRLTHPKREDSIDVSDRNLKDLAEARTWFRKVAAQLYKAHAARQE